MVDFHENHYRNLKIFLLISILFFILLVLLSGKYLHGKYMWNYYADKMQDQLTSTALDASEEQALMLATIIGTSGMTKAPANLEKLIITLSQQFDRDIVVMDTKKIILADTVPLSIGAKYTLDEANEVQKTIEDGKTRRFIERSSDYPGGISQVVVALRESDHAIIGALILSTSHTNN